MPELPEVETIKNQLGKTIKRKKIIGVKISSPKMIKAPLKKFRRAVLNSKINNVRRRAKLLIIDITNGNSLLIHLKMTGQLIFYPYRKIGRQNNKHARVIFIFSDKSFLLFNDLRKFGYIKLLKTNKIKELLDKEYGPEPLGKNLTLSALKNLMSKKPRARIKQFLMDQKNIAGIGNIYADEILYSIGILPTRKISTLAKNETKKIYRGIKNILTNAIKFRGSSVSNYLDSYGRAGEYHLKLKVYSRVGQPCLKCKTKIQKIKLAGRGTHFCPKCQK